MEQSLSGGRKGNPGGKTWCEGGMDGKNWSVENK